MDLEALYQGVRAANRAMLGRAITLIESTHPDHRADAEALLERLLPHSGKAVRVGITGVPGVGKSTFIERLGKLLTARGQKVAVLTIDPSSELSGGSILGDKTRMAELAADPLAFIRPSPTAGTLGGVAKKTREAMSIVEAAGFDVVLVETVGVGQSETTVAEMVDTFLLLLLPGAGDELQGIKRGILELSDVVAIHKADGDAEQSARLAESEYKAALRILRGSDRWVPPVLRASSVTKTGIAEVWQAIEDHRAAAIASGAFEARRAEQRARWFERLLEAEIVTRFLDREGIREKRDTLLVDVRAGRVSPSAAIAKLLAG
jgi:LAO/AO transport system kinase